MLEALEDGIDFSSRRGLGTISIGAPAQQGGVELSARSSKRSKWLAASTKSAEAIRRLPHRRRELQMIGVQHAAEAGGNADIDHVDALVDQALEAGALDTKVQHLAIGATALVRDAPEHAISLLNRLDQMPGGTETPYYARFLPGAVRAAITAGELELGRRLANRLKPLYALHEHALCAAQAELAEAVRDHDEAATCMPMQPSAGKALATSRTRVRSARPGPLPCRARTTRGCNRHWPERQELFGSTRVRAGARRSPTSCCADYPDGESACQRNVNQRRQQSQSSRLDRLWFDLTAARPVPRRLLAALPPAERGRWRRYSGAAISSSSTALNVVHCSSPKRSRQDCSTARPAVQTAVSSAWPRVGQLDDAGAAVRGIWMALDIAQALELSQHVVGRLPGQASRRGDLAGRRPSTPAKRKSAIMAVVTSSCPAAWMRASISVFPRS